MNLQTGYVMQRCAILSVDSPHQDRITGFPGRCSRDQNAIHVDHQCLNRQGSTSFGQFHSRRRYAPTVVNDVENNKRDFRFALGVVKSVYPVRHLMVIWPMDPTVRCVGCGAWVPATDGPTHRYMLSAPACWATYGELTAVLLSDPSATSYRQLCVDAFAVQHPGEPNEQAIQSVAAHLLSLYGSIELNVPAGASHRVINQVTARKGEYAWLTPPAAFSVTVPDVLANRDQLHDAAYRWARSAWDAWRPHHDQVKAWHSALFV